MRAVPEVDSVPNDRYIRVMPPRLVTDDQLLTALVGLFGDRGFDSASLADIALATGLQKSSLYHRFPGGKQQMATEVANRIGSIFGSVILAPLESDRPLRDQV